MSTRTAVIGLMMAAALGGGCKTTAPRPTAAQVSREVDVSEASFKRWLDGYVAAVEPLHKQQALTYWKASGSGKKEDYDAVAEAELALSRLNSDAGAFDFIKQVRAAGQVKDPHLARQLEIVYSTYLSNQIDPALMEQLVRLSSSIEERFNTWRAEVDGKVLSDNEVEAVLKTSTDSAYRKKVWEASKQIGALVAPDLLALVRLRNQAARQLGYEHYYALSLAMGEQNEQELFELIDEMARLTDAPFQQLRAELDASFASRYHLQASEIRPWHMEDRFFQDTPASGTVDLDPYLKGRDPNELTARFYESIGLDLRSVMASSDLVGREGKYQHAYCMDVDRAGDVRVMASVQDNLYWMDTQLHEFGHAAYSRGHDANPALPYLLRDSAHTFTTEGVANLMGRLASNPRWLKRFAELSEADATRLEPLVRKRSRYAALIFARWCMVMANFERELYRNPEQDLNGLWWKLVQRYQLITPPEGRNAPDWASKIHLVSSPVYYHNYLLGDLYASQLHDRIVRQFFPGQDPFTVIYADHPEVGQFLNQQVFAPGASLAWPEFVEASTGEPLSARAFAAAFMQESK